jgi:hypothetical protein
MDWAELVLDYFRALVWPTLLLCIALLFREQLRNLIDGISEVTGPGNVSFKRRLNQVKIAAQDANQETREAVAARDVPSSQAHLAHPKDAALERYLERASSDPVGTINGAWRLVRSVVRDTTRDLGTDRELPPGALTSQHVRSLVPLGLSEDMVGVTRELTNLRNDVVKGRRIKTDENTALSFLAATEELLEAVAEVAAMPRPPSSEHLGTANS